MPKTRQQKEDTVQILTDKLQKANSVVFADYKGLNMSQLSNLRDKLREQEAELAVTKNSLMKISLKNNQFLVADEVTDGPTATLFAYGDEISPIKTLVKALKEANMGKVKAGLMNGETLDAFTVTRLSNLPTKQELRGTVVGVLVAPLSGMLNVLQGNMRNLVYALDAIRKSKGGE